MKIILPILFLLAAVGIFFVYVDPTYSSIKELQVEEAQFDEALDRSKELIDIRDDLLAKYNAFRTEDLERLEKLLPDNVDNVRLIIDIDSIASQYGMSLRNVSVSSVTDEDGTLGPDAGEYGSIILSFTVSSSYDNFVQFITDLEQSLRIVDIDSLSFTASEVNLNEYTISLRTYWLR